MSSHLVERMKQWDDQCLGSTQSSGTQTEVFANTIPLERRGVQAVNNDCGMDGLGFGSILGVVDFDIDTPTKV